MTRLILLLVAFIALIKCGVQSKNSIIVDNTNIEWVYNGNYTFFNVSSPLSSGMDPGK